MKTASIDWNEQGNPVSGTFDDIYFSRENGLAESRHVFLQGCDVEKLILSGKDIAIAETGFGTGLNFLATWQAFNHLKQAGQSMHYISIEAFPLTRADITRALSAFPELSGLLAKLANAYPNADPGFHRIYFREDHVSLTLVFATAIDALKQISACIDAWYLDGFAPAKNPEMWSLRVFQQMARLSHKGTRIASFTAAGQVRRDLQKTGFRMHKQKGFGRKREMLTGEYRTDHCIIKSLPASSRIVIIGAGIAGASCAHALKKRGYNPVVIDKASHYATGASGNPAGVIAPALHAQIDSYSLFYLQAFAFCRAQIMHLRTQGHIIQGKLQGSLRLEKNTGELNKLLARLDEMGLDTNTVIKADHTDLLKQLPNTAAQALFYPSAGWVSPGEWISALLNDVHFMGEHELTGLHYEEPEWKLHFKTGKTIPADVVILANAQGTIALEQCRNLPLDVRKGQVTLVKGNVIPEPPCPISGSQYAIPLPGDQLLLGSTFDHIKRDQWQNRVFTSQDADQRNINSFNHLYDISKNGLKIKSSRAALRCISRDHWPICGRLQQSRLSERVYKQNRKPESLQEEDLLPGLYISTAHGSRGLVSSPLCGEIIASQIAGEPAPTGRDILNALHPARFALRDLDRED